MRFWPASPWNLGLLLALTALWACGSPPSARSGGPTASQVRAAPAPSAAAEPENSARRKIAAVDASIIFTDCPKAPIARAHDVEHTLNRLVEDCESVPEGRARFIATLVPGGRIQLAAPAGEKEGVVPLCVLRHELRHRLLVMKPCHLEIQMSERTTPSEPQR